MGGLALLPCVFERVSYLNPLVILGQQQQGLVGQQVAQLLQLLQHLLALPESHKLGEKGRGVKKRLRCWPLPHKNV